MNSIINIHTLKWKRVNDPSKYDTALSDDGLTLFIDLPGFHGDRCHCVFSIIIFGPINKTINLSNLFGFSMAVVIFDVCLFFYSASVKTRSQHATDKRIDFMKHFVFSSSYFYLVRRVFFSFSLGSDWFEFETDQTEFIQITSDFFTHSRIEGNFFQERNVINLNWRFLCLVSLEKKSKQISLTGLNFRFKLSWLHVK